MENVFPPNRDMHETYDLKACAPYPRPTHPCIHASKQTFPGWHLTKGAACGQGSTVGRYTEPKPGKTPILKDNNFLQAQRRLRLGPQKRALFLAQIRRDSDVRCVPSMLCACLR
jgi:hypothetical protein